MILSKKDGDLGSGDDDDDDANEFLVEEKAKDQLDLQVEANEGAAQANVCSGTVLYDHPHMDFIHH